MTETRWWKYVERVIGHDPFSTAASKAGFDKSAFTRWKRGAAADPAFAVKLARAYGSSVLEALVEAELITAEEASLKFVDTSTHLSDRELVRKLAHRIDPNPAAWAGTFEDSTPVSSLTERRSNITASDVGLGAYAADSSDIEPEEGDDDYGGGA